MENANTNCNISEPDHMDFTTCHGCKKPIEDEYRLRVSPDLEWHAACLTCTECQRFLDETCTCFMNEGKPYCRRDYVRLFGIKCCNCSEHILATDLVMRARSQVFHLECFRCCTCERKLIPGEQFGVRSEKLFCKMDYDSVVLNTPSSPTGSSPLNENSSPITIEGKITATTTGSSSSSRTKRSNSEKGPRVRTVLSEQQLQTLRTVYASNPRPDALLKEHLVEITGLNPRVIRVWFQNKRCKDKKRVLAAEAAARMQQQGAPKVIPPLTPQTPLTPDSIGQISPHHGMSVFTYPPAPNSYEHMPTTPNVSPIVTYHHNPAWGSPTEVTMSHFEGGGDFSSPISTEQQQTFIYSSTNTTQPNHFAY